MGIGLWVLLGEGGREGRNGKLVLIRRSEDGGGLGLGRSSQW